jgi:hypothetical protein
MDTTIIVVLLLVCCCSISSSSSIIGFFYKDDILNFFSPPVVSIKITRPKTLSTANDLHHLHIREIYVFKKDGTKLPLKCANPCTNSLGTETGNPVTNAFDGNESTESHSKYTENGASIYATKVVNEDHFIHLIIDGIKSVKEISKIKIVHRTTAQTRFVGAIIQLMENNNPKLSTVINEAKEIYEIQLNTTT